MKFFTTLLFSMLCTFSLFAQAEDYQIEFNIKNYPFDSLTLAYKYGNKQLIKETLVAQAPGKFIYKGSDTIPNGMYLLVFQPNREFLEFIIDKGDHHFSVTADAKKLTQLPTFKGSTSNPLFQEYVQYMTSIRQKAAIVQQAIQRQDSLKNTKRKNELIQDFNQLDKQVSQYQDKFIQEHAGTMPALIVKSIREIKLPDFSGDALTVRKKQYQYYREHYFDNIDFSDDRLLFTNFFDQRVVDYVDKLVPQQPDSLIQALDMLLKRMEPSPKIYRYYAVDFLNKYANSRIAGFDAIFVHLANTYLKTGKINHIEEGQKATILHNAELMEPLLFGKKAPNITLYEEDGSAHSIYDVDKDYTVIYFWGPDCGYCKKAAPDLVKFYKEFKKKVAVITICNQLGDDSKNCWEGVKHHEFDDMINLSDPKNTSHFHTKYYVRLTPTIYILNKDKRIIMKTYQAKDLVKIMTDLILKGN